MMRGFRDPQTVDDMKAALRRLSVYPHRTYVIDDHVDSGRSDSPMIPAPIDTAIVVSSKIGDAVVNGQTMHTVMIDIDHPARLIRSSTPGHYHLFVDVPVRSDRYYRMLSAMAAAGVVEAGFAHAARTNGGTTLRLPWRKKPRPVVEAAPAGVFGELLF